MRLGPTLTYTCPYCGEITATGFCCDLHSGCTFECEHCGKLAVIEPMTIEKRAALYNALGKQENS